MLISNGLLLFNINEYGSVLGYYSGYLCRGKEASCIQYDLHKGIDDSTYVLYEVWKDNEALTRHAHSIKSIERALLIYLHRGKYIGYKPSSNVE
ncbi:putative quinol monooxygenase [Brevibacillus choshinensis]|uniref:putative quinol monooxygenase n=1 Tax=Brevibacillus choshinensis TaxID=54911 RepID=UPI0006EC0ACC